MKSLLQSIIVSVIVTIPLAAAGQPNILLIMVDDMGFSDIGCYGGEMKTPVLDGLAANGLRYTQFYNTARCWPTRSSLLTGFYPQAIGRDKLKDLPGGGYASKRPSWAPLLPGYLKSAGYHSYHSGKWHIDGEPLKTGFERSFTFRRQNRFFAEDVFGKVYEEFPHLKKSEGVYSTTAIADHAIGVLQDHQKQKRGKAFFSYVAFSAPHFPLQALPEDIEAVGGRYEAGWEKIRKERWKRIQQMKLLGSGSLSPMEPEVGPPYDWPEAFKILGDGEVQFPLPWDELTDEQKRFQSTKMAIHAAMIERVDIAIGRILEQLKEMKVFEDTLIMFMSDNGASAEINVRGDGHDPKADPGSAATFLCLGPGWSTASNTPFRKHKSWVYEGGACTPLIVHWPAVIKAKGELRRTPAHVVDIVPTILSFTGLDLDRAMDFSGINIAPTFTRDVSYDRGLWFAHEHGYAIRRGDWKLVSDKESEWELYDLSKDRTECNNLAAKHPDKVKELEKEWKRHVAEFRQMRETR